MELRWPKWIGVVADDLEKQRRFYRDTLGFRETASTERYIDFRMPDGGVFELVRRDASPQYGGKRFQVGFTVDDIRKAREELIDRGAQVVSEIEGLEPGSKNLWCYFRDPEGNFFEITQWLKDPEG